MVRKVVVSLVSLAAIVSVFACSASSSKFADRTPEKHRATAPVCDHVRPDTEPVISDGSPASCTKNADCTQGENGRCVGNAHNGWQCTYDVCFADADCGAGAGICSCDASYGANACITGGCRVDADCKGSSPYCSPTFGSCGNYSGVVGYECHTDDDECLDDADCGPADSGTFGAPYCMFDHNAGHWKCSTSHCAG